MPRFGAGVTKLQIPETVMATTGSWIWNLVPPSPKREKPGSPLAQPSRLRVQAASRRKIRNVGRGRLANPQAGTPTLQDQGSSLRLSQYC